MSDSPSLQDVLRELNSKIVTTTKATEELKEELRKTKALIRKNEAACEEYQENIAYLRRHNAGLANACFTLLGWNIDQASSFASAGDKEIYEQMSAWVNYFTQMQMNVAPETFKQIYGVDPITGDKIGPGITDDEVKVSAHALDCRIEDVPITKNAYDRFFD